MRKPPVRGGLSSKYDNPAARREAAAKLGQGDKPASDEPVTQRMLLDAPDAGEDPTETDEDDGVGGATGAKQGSSHCVRLTPTPRGYPVGIAKFGHTMLRPPWWTISPSDLYPNR